MTCKSNPIKQRNLIFLLPKLFTTEDQEGQGGQISVLCKYIRQIIITRPRNVKEANNSETRASWYTDRGSCSMKLDEHACKILSVLSFREKVVFVTVALEFYCPSTLLRSFRVRSIIITTSFLGSHHALVHILSPVHGCRNCFMTNLHKRKKYMTVEIVSL